jgi:purine-nucleoside phosphorylase
VTALLAQLGEALRFVQARTTLRPVCGVVLGSGLAPLARALDGATRIPLAEIPHFPVGRVEGQGSEMVVGHWRGLPVAVLTGRPHLYEGFAAAELAFPARLLSRLGAEDLILTSAVGSANVNYRPGEVVVLHDHINLTGANPLTGVHQEAFGPRYPDMTEAYDRRLREIAEKACWKVGATVRGGVYAAFAGPSYETPAEVRMARTLGADVVGMSVVHEVIAARQLGLRVLALCCVTNMAAGLLTKPLSHAEVLATAAQARDALADTLGVILEQLGGDR